MTAKSNSMMENQAVESNRVEEATQEEPVLEDFTQSLRVDNNLFGVLLEQINVSTSSYPDIAHL